MRDGGAQCGRVSRSEDRRFVGGDGSGAVLVDPVRRLFVRAKKEEMRMTMNRKV